MATLTKGDLQNRYSWTAIGDDDPKKTGSPDHQELNRHEGYEVLPFLNKTFPTNADALKAERGLQQVPSSLRSRANVLKWLKDNWATIR